MPKLIPPPVYEDRGYHTPCLIWQGRPSGQGYARITENQIMRPAHVVLWERVNGPVPEGYELDHLCYVRMCVELTHLECVTKAENRRRAALRITREVRSAAAHVSWRTREKNGTTRRKTALRERIRRRLEAGETYRQIASAERCGHTIISEVCNGRR